MSRIKHHFTPNNVAIDWKDMPASYFKDLPASVLVATYLMSSYLYYEHDEAVISDEAYDALCKRLLESQLMWANHQHARLVDTEALKAGTGYHLTKAYPDRVKYAAQRWLKEATGRDINVKPTTEKLNG